MVSIHLSALCCLLSRALHTRPLCVPQALGVVSMHQPALCCSPPQALGVVSMYQPAGRNNDTATADLGLMLASYAALK